MVQKIILLFLALLFISFISPEVQKKVIRKGEYDIECFVALKTLKKYKEDKVYYWYKSREIHFTKGMTGGKVLEGEFKKYYKSNQLAEQGKFDMGLKEDSWYSWFENGEIKSIVEWKNGYRHGDYIIYDSIGNLASTGSYRKNKKHGEWINYSTGDTLKYKRGKLIAKKADSLQTNFFKRLFNTNNHKDTLSKNDTLKKPGFFKRLFSKDKDSLKVKDAEKEKTGFFKRLFGRTQQEKNKD